MRPVLVIVFLLSLLWQQVSRHRQDAPVIVAWQSDVHRGTGIGIDFGLISSPYLATKSGIFERLRLDRQKECTDVTSTTQRRSRAVTPKLKFFDGDRFCGSSGKSHLDFCLAGVYMSNL
jgi:hypothetical protein